MATKLEIINDALIKVGAEVVTTYTESKGAKLANAQYEQAKKYLLRRHLWNFAIKTVQLADPDELGDEYAYGYSFDLPLDFVRLVSVEDNDDYVIEGNKLLSNNSTENIRYIWNVDNDTLFDSNFAEAFAAYLAWKICYAITQSNTLKQNLMEEFVEIFRKAKTPDAQEQPSPEVGADYYLEARLSGSSPTPKRNW